MEDKQQSHEIPDVSRFNSLILLIYLFWSSPFTKTSKVIAIVCFLDVLTFKHFWLEADNAVKISMIFKVKDLLVYGNIYK